MQRFEPIRILFDIRCSNIEYRTLSNIEPFRTLEIFDQSNHRISNHRTSSNIELFRILQIFDRSNHRISNHRTLSNIKPFRILQIFDRSNHRISNIEPHRMSNLFQPENVRSIEPSNIEYRTSNSNIHRMVR